MSSDREDAREKQQGLAIWAVQEFLKGHRVLYAVPVQEQIQRWWSEVTTALAEPIAQGIFKKNETWHTIELPGTEQRLRGKTAFNADTLRGDFATRLILDEFSFMNEDAWSVVGAPMMLDRPSSIAVFAFTPPSFRTAGQSKAHDPRHASKLFKQAQAERRAAGRPSISRRMTTPISARRPWRTLRRI